MDRDEMSNLYRGPSIDASYQVSVHLAQGFQRKRLKCEKLTDDGHQVMAKTHIAFGKVSEKVQKDKQRSTKHTHKTKDRVNAGINIVSSSYNFQGPGGSMS
jgi:signal transduction histidine kinase